MTDRARLRFGVAAAVVATLAACTSPGAQDDVDLEDAEGGVDVASIASRAAPEGWPGANVAWLASRAFLDDAEFLGSLETEELCLDGHTSYVGGVALAPGGDLVVTGSPRPRGARRAE